MSRNLGRTLGLLLEACELQYSLNARSFHSKAFRVFRSSLHHIQVQPVRGLSCRLLRGHLFTPSQLVWKPRHYVSDVGSSSLEVMSEQHFHRLADAALEDLLERIESFVEDIALEEDCDIEYSQGVLTIKLGSLGTFVINKQTPNRQIWLSSPVSGPFRYDWIDGHWHYARDGHSMHEKLERDLKSLTGEEVDLNPCNKCENLGVCSAEDPLCLRRDEVGK